MLSTAARRGTTALLSARTALRPAVLSSVRSHCQVPCGIFDDPARVEALKRVSQAVYGTTKADWSAVIADSDIFDADDKRFLDIDDYDDGDEFD